MQCHSILFFLCKGGKSRPQVLAEQTVQQRDQGDADEGNAAGHELLHALALGRGVIAAVTLQQVDSAPHAETGTKSHDQSLKNFDSRVEESQSLSPFIIKRFRSFVHARNLVVLRCITAARLIFWCTFLTVIN